MTGIVENMAGFVCGHCGEVTEIFGRGGGERFARDHGIEFLGSIPLDVTVRQGADVGSRRSPSASRDRPPRR